MSKKKSSFTQSGLIAWLVGTGLFLENLDSTIINTSIPQMASELDVYSINLKIAITSYLLTLAAFIPISGYMADKYGTKKVFLSALIIFLFGSALCGFATTLFMLVIGRLIQGVGGAMMTPVGRLILIKIYPRSELVKAFSHLTFLGQIAPALGPLIGGVLTTFASWRLIFFVNLPIGLIAIFLISYFMENMTSENKRRFDFYGFMIFGVGIGLLTFALTLLTEQAAQTSLGVILLIASVSLLLFYLWRSKNTTYPLLDLKLFNISSFRIAVLGSLVVRIGIGGIPFLLPLLFQLNFGFNPLISGLCTVPYGIAMFVAKLFVHPLLKRFGFKKLLFFNPLFIAASLLLLALLSYDLPIYLILTLIFTTGFFCSLQFTYMNLLNFVDIQESDKSKATSLSSVFQLLAMNFGVCMATALLILASSSSSSFFIPLSAFRYALAGLAILAAASVFLFRRLPPVAGTV